MRAFRFLTFLLSLIVLVPLAGSAATDPVQETVKSSPSIGSLSIALNKSTSVSFSTPAATVFIANPEIADVQVVTPTRVMVSGKKIGETTLLISDEKGGILVNRTVVVSQNLSDLERALRTVAPTDKLTVKPVPGGIVLMGEVSDPTLIETARRVAARYVPDNGGDIINRIKLRGNNQIQIQVRFAEVSRDADKRLGINWENTIKAGNFFFGFATGADFYKGLGEELIRTSMGDGDTNNAFTMQYNKGGSSVNGMIDALAKNGLVTILAEPNLTAMSGETASFLAGGEFPVPVPQGGQSNTLTIEWKQYGVSLAFTPTILNGNRINLHVRPEVSQLSDVGAVTINDITVPALVTRRAETTIELGSGQSFAIAGLLNNSQTQSIAKFPFLGDVPVIGPLFRSTRFQNNESELVIIITPYIVKPTKQENLALPTDGYAHPTDVEQAFELRQTSHDEDMPTLSGAPRAVTVDVPDADQAPSPEAIPQTPVTLEPVSEAPVVEEKPVVQEKKKVDKKPAEKNASVKKAAEKKPVEKKAAPPAEPISVPPEPLSTPLPKQDPGAARLTGPGGFIME